LRASGSGSCLLMYQSGGSRLRLQRALAAVGHECVACRQRDVLEIRGNARPTVDRNGSGVLVASGGIAHHFNSEIRLAGCRRPRKCDAEKAAFEQERVRLLLVLRKVRAVGTVDWSEERVFAP